MASYYNNTAEAKESFEHIKDPKARRLAEYVSNIEEIRKTSGAEGFQRGQTQKIKDIMNILLEEREKVEEQTVCDENQVFCKTEANYYDVEDKLEIECVKEKQKAEVRALKQSQEELIDELKKRMAAKKFEREEARELKSLCNSTRERESIQNKADGVRVTLKKHTERCERTIKDMTERHELQISRFKEAARRQRQDQEVMIELQTRHFADDKKKEALDDHKAKASHQRVIEKKKLEHLREKQRLERIQFRDRSEYETKMLEQFSNFQAKQSQEETELIKRNQTEYKAEKEKVLAARNQVKLLTVQSEHQDELNRLANRHRAQIRGVRQEQITRKQKRMKYWEGTIGKEAVGTAAAGNGYDSASEDGELSSQHSRSTTSSRSTIASVAVKNVDLRKQKSVINAANARDQDTVLQSQKNHYARQALETMEISLEETMVRHEEMVDELRAKHQTRFKRMEEEFQSHLVEVEYKQDMKMKELKKSQEDSIMDTIVIQAREIQLEKDLRLRESRKLVERKVLNTLLDNLHDAVISIDLKGCITRFNNAAERMWGYQADQVLGNNVKMLMNPEDAGNHDQYLYNYLSTGVKRVIGTTREITAQKRDGSDLPIRLSVSEVSEEGVRLFNAFVTDITDEMQQVKLREAEEDCLPQMIWKADPNGDSYYLNQRFIDFTGLTEGNVFDQAVVHPDDWRKSIKDFQIANQTKEPFETKRRLLGKDGNYKWFLTRASPILDENYKIVSWCGSCTDVDVTTKLQVEMEALPEVLPQALWKADLDGNVLYANSNFMVYLGAKKNTHLNVFSPTIIHKDDVQKSKKIFNEAVDEKKSFETKRRILGVSGQYKWFLTRGSPVFDESGQDVVAYYGSCTDIHEETLQQLEMAALPESLPQLVWKADHRGNVRYANKRFMGYVGATEYTGLNVFADSVVHPDDYKASLQALNKGNKDKAEFSLKRRLLDKDGVYHKMHTIAVPILNEEKKVLGWYGTCTQEED